MQGVLCEAAGACEELAERNLEAKRLQVQRLRERAAAHTFDTSVLKVLEETCTLYLAKCGNCHSNNKNIASAEMTCNLCRLTKPASSFSPARQRARNYATRRCKACDFPPCCSCGTVPTQPKQAPYMCFLCRWPPCGCGAPRPPYSQNRVSVKPTWQCQACIASK